MPANRSRTLHWRSCLDQIHERNGAIEVALARSDQAGGSDGTQLVWRVRVLSLTDEEITIEQPMTLGQVIPIVEGVSLVAVMAIGQNRWMFNTEHLGSVDHQIAPQRTVPALRLRMPESVQRCQRRNYYRVETAAINLPRVEVWPLMDPKSVVVAERANELRFVEEKKSLERLERLERHDGIILGDEIMPEVGPKFTARLMNIGGGGSGLRVAPEHQQILQRHKLYWLRFALPPELSTPICASAKLVHTHMESDQFMYAGLAFDFSFNAAHQCFVVEQICRFIAVQQRMQLEEEVTQEADAQATRKSA